MWSCPSCSWVNRGVRCGNCNRKHGAPAENVSFVSDNFERNTHRGAAAQRPVVDGKRSSTGWNVQTNPDGTAWV